jgi:hypothetical protein
VPFHEPAASICQSFANFVITMVSTTARATAMRPWSSTLRPQEAGQIPGRHGPNNGAVFTQAMAANAGATFFAVEAIGR